MAEAKPSRQEVQKYAAKVALEVGVPSSVFLSLCNQESGFNVKARSGVGAYGVCQIMPGTAKGIAQRYRKKYGRDLDYTNWKDNVLMGALYLDENIARFNGSISKGLAAYNAGPGAVKKYNGVPPFPETQRYVKSILAGTKKYSNSTSLVVGYDASGLKDAATGRASVSRYQDLANSLMEINDASGGTWQGIKTNRPELLEDKPEYSDYAELRKLTINGNPMFTEGDYPAELVNSFDGNMVGFQNGIETGVAETLFNTQNYNYEPESVETIQSLVAAFQDRYKPYSEDGEPFGMANLSYEDYERYGIKGDNLANPEIQARTLVNEFQKAKYFFDNEDLAFHAIAGGLFTTEDGEQMGWNQLKDNPNRYNSTWYQTYRDDQEKKTLQALNNNYNEYRKSLI